jgi:orotate phosphoribosyltransferase
VSDAPALIRLLRERSLERGDFVLASGRRSTYYIDARRTTMSAVGQVLVGRCGLAAIRGAGWAPGAVGGLTMGADPVACAIAATSAASPPVIDAFSVRKQLKGHGTDRRIEGNFSPASPVVVVEDVITSGGSALAAIDAVEEAGGRVVGVFAVVDREEGGVAAIQGRGIDVVVFTTTSYILAT